jgi:hypothetical protein
LLPRLAILADAANDFRASVRRARARGRHPPAADSTAERESADEVKRRLDQTRTRLRDQIPPRED